MSIFFPIIWYNLTSNTNIFNIILCLVAVTQYVEYKESSKKYVIKTLTRSKQELVFYGEAFYDSHYFFGCLLISRLFSEAQISLPRNCWFLQVCGEWKLNTNAILISHVHSNTCQMNMSPVWPYIKTGKEYASLVFLEVPLKALYCATLMHRPTQVDSITVLCFIYVDQGSCLVWNDVGFLSKAVLTMLCFICE